ncbi:RHS repeat-associated core domain-containing protein, partial [Pseudomonas versuta]
MRFHSRDSLSPFGEGGLNGYAYCAGDPVNRIDPSGHAW